MDVNSRLGRLLFKVAVAAAFLLLVWLDARAATIDVPVSGPLTGARFSTSCAANLIRFKRDLPALEVVCAAPGDAGPPQLILRLDGFYSRCKTARVTRQGEAFTVACVL